MAIPSRRLMEFDAMQSTTHMAGRMRMKKRPKARRKLRMRK